jgi:hypothetical protein
MVIATVRIIKSGILALAPNEVGSAGWTLNKGAVVICYPVIEYISSPHHGYYRGRLEITHNETHPDVVDPQNKVYHAVHFRNIINVWARFRLGVVTIREE